MEYIKATDENRDIIFDLVYEVMEKVLPESPFIPQGRKV